MAPVYSTGSSPDDICTIKQVIADMKARLKDPDLARLFENTFPNTLGMTSHFLTVDNIKLQSFSDTTVKYFNAVSSFHLF